MDSTITEIPPTRTRVETKVVLIEIDLFTRYGKAWIQIRMTLPIGAHFSADE